MWGQCWPDVGSVLAWCGVSAGLVWGQCWPGVGVSGGTGWPGVGQWWDWLAWHGSVVGLAGLVLLYCNVKFYMQLLSECGNIFNCLGRSVTGVQQSWQMLLGNTSSSRSVTGGK